jgi:hypothetical protein
MLNFDKLCPQKGPQRHLPVQVSTAQQNESKNVLNAAA